MAEFLLELFSEEIPARFQKQAADDLGRIFCEKLKASALTFDHAKAHVTPRRLALVIEGLPLEQPSRTEEKKGPKIDAPAAAVEGFLKSVGLSSLDQCEQRDTPKGKIWIAVSHIEGRKVKDVLPELIEQTLREIPWKKSMNWGRSTFRWVRPLHTICAIFDGEGLNGTFDLGGGQPAIQFTDHVQGHRFLSTGSFAVNNFADYQNKLKDAGVILDREERKRIILEQADVLLKDKSLALKEDADLLDEVCGLVEWPVPLLGRIDDAFMSIPPEVLITTMRNNQKYFATLDSSGKMSPYFVITANLPTEDQGAMIIAGNERVLRARFSDAKFFWDQDRKTSLDDYATRLSSITFHAKLGTMQDKVKRISVLATSLAPYTKADEADVQNAVRWCKADLVTGMVGEFPELQGIMGAYYAREERRADQICQAIAQHYAPLGPHDQCPTLPVSITVALADKLDTLISFFSIDEKPTGSKDPYALRRSALGVLRLIIENNLSLDLGAFLPEGTGLQEFFIDRLIVMLRDKGYRHDIISAVFLQEGIHDVMAQLAKVKALNCAIDSTDGKALLALYRRAVNILRIEEKKDAKIYSALDHMPTLSTGTAEKTLYASLDQTAQIMRPLMAKKSFDEGVKIVLSLRPPIDQFFEAVMVNDKDTGVRAERLQLLAKVRDTLHLFADLSRIEGE